MSEFFAAANAMTTTENGAITYTTSGAKCLDFFSTVGALRNAPATRIRDLFLHAFQEDPETAMKTLFYARDIRNGGLGEKRVFRTIVASLPTLLPTLNRTALYDAIVEFGSWKDIFEAFPIDDIKEYVGAISAEHRRTQKYDLLEKYMPSTGGAKNGDAEKLAKFMGMTPKEYRKYLSTARSQIKIVEQKMCSGNWTDIRYEAVPSKAGLIYRKAFLKHDAEGYRDFLSKVTSGEKKIHAGTLYPYELVSKYKSNNGIDTTVEEMWKTLPDYTEGRNENAIVMADVSGSMYGLPLEVSISLAIYFAERNQGKFHNEFMTFSSNPSFVSLDGCTTLREKVTTAERADWGGCTDLCKAFRNILSVGKRFHLPEKEMPRTIYVISDMEFDEATGSGWYDTTFDVTNYEMIKTEYAAAGYTVPNIVFWNVDSRQNNLPVTKDEIGTALVSGCSPSVFKMVMSGDINPVKVMHELLDGFEGWGKAVNRIMK